MGNGTVRWLKGICAGCAIFFVSLTLVLLLTGCEKSIADKQKEYSAKYRQIIDAFQAQVAKDDAKANQFIQSNDLPGLIKLNNQRLASIKDTFGKLLLLYPPDDLRRVHGETLYYLVAVIDQVQAQNAYAEAVLTGKPSGDLESIAGTTTTKAQSIGRDLGLDLEKANITIKGTPSKPQGQPQTAPASSNPAGGSAK